jgi:hypothetical protein
MKLGAYSPAAAVSRRNWKMKRVMQVVLLLASLASLTLLASAQEALSAGTVEGTLDSAIATYQLSAEEGDEFFLFLNSADFDPYIEITDSNAEIIATDDDSGAGSNSALLFVAPETATYTVNARAYDGEATGSYALTLVTEIEDVSVGASLDLEMDGATPSAFRFEANGDPVDIVVDSGGEIDTSLRVVSPEGYAVDSSDDAIGSDPALTPIILSAGTYYLVIVPYSEAAIGTVTLSIESAELNALSAEPTIFTFGDAGNEDIATVEVEEGTLYRFEVGAADVSDFNLSLSAADPDLYSYGYFSFTNGLGGTYLYRADVTGTLRVQLSAGFMITDSEGVEFTITFAEVGE